MDANDVAVIVVRSYSNSAARIDPWVCVLGITSNVVPILCH